MDTINTERLTELFLGCLFTEQEVEAANGQPPEGAVIVDGLTGKFGFHPGRLAAARDELKAMLRLLPEKFFDNSEGKGASFLLLCDDRNGRQWTSFHRVMEQLVCLAIATDLMVYPMPREYWFALPGGMPYVQIKSAAVA